MAFLYWYELKTCANTNNEMQSAWTSKGNGFLIGLHKTCGSKHHLFTISNTEVTIDIFKRYRWCGKRITEK